MYLCILNPAGTILLHKNMKTSRENLLKALAPYRDDLVLAVECLFTSALTPVSLYLLHPCSRGTGADVCAEENIAFVLGHALYMTKSSGTILNSFSRPAGQNTGMCFVVPFMAAR